MRHVAGWLTSVGVLVFAAALASPVKTFSQEAAAGAPETTTAKQEILRALETSGDFQFVEIPLADMVEYIRQRYGISVVVDKLALEDVGISLDMPITRSLSGVSLRSALRLTLSELELTFAIHDESLVITTPEEAINRLDTVVYDVADLTRTRNEFGEIAYDALEMIYPIVELVASESWDNVGGPGSVRGLHGRSLIVSQTHDIHEQIARLLRTMRTIRDRQAAGMDVDTCYFLQPMGSNEAAIRTALDKPARLQFVDAPLSDVVEFLSQTYGIEVEFDQIALDDVGVGVDTPVTAALSNMSLRSALRLLLRELQLTYMVQDEVLLITTPEEQEQRLKIGVYPVADLLRSPRDDDDSEQDYDSVISIIIECIAPESWTDVGGPGPIRELSAIQSLGIAQTDDVHEQIAQVLTDLRKSRRKPDAGDDPFGGDEAPADDDPFSANIDDDQDAAELALRFYRLNPSSDDEYDGQDVIRLISTVIEPDIWGARDDVVLMYVRGSLVVRHHAQAHREIRRILTELRVLAGSHSPFIHPGGGGGFGGGDGSDGGEGGGFFRVPPGN